MPRRSPKASEPQGELNLANVLPRRGQGTDLPSRDEAGARIEGDCRPVRRADVEDEAAEAARPGPRDDRVDEGGTDALAARFGATHIEMR